MKIIPYILLIVLLLTGCDSNNSGQNWEYPPPKYNPVQLQQFIDNIAATYPAIAYKKVIGTTKNGHDIIALIISNNPENPAENEPRIRLTGSIHGDEHVTTALLCELITFLTQGYASSAEVQQLVDTNYIVIIPMLNPDGVEALNRYNANGVDLNRNFDTTPSSIWTSGSSHGDSPFSENETIAIDNFSTTYTRFHLSATYHSGSAIINLPFDYASKNAGGDFPAEYSLVQFLAKEHYAKQGTFLETPDLMSGLLVEDGTINGGDWYIINGSLQDWSYLETGCIDLTIEISDQKYGHTENELEAIYDYNINSILAYIQSASFGVSGQITDTLNNPISDAAIYINGSDLIIHSDNNGYFHKILHGSVGDSYSLQIEAAGYTGQSISITLDAENRKTNTVSIIMNEE